MEKPDPRGSGKIPGMERGMGEDAHSPETEVCGYDACTLPGYCDGRHCLHAGGRIRPDPEESAAEDAARALGRALALLRPSAGLAPRALHQVDAAAAREALELIEVQLQRAGIVVIDPA